MSEFYILDEHKKPVATDIQKYGLWIDNPKNKIVDQTRLDDETLISTVFLGISHGAGTEGPILWESMAFFPQDEEEQEWQMRYDSHEKAVLGHKAMVRLARTRKTQMGRTMLLDWDEAWRMACVAEELEDDDG